MTAPLSNSQYRLLSFVDLFTEAHGWPPSCREICKGTGLKSTSSVAYQLNALEAMGYLRRGPHGQVRALSVVK